MRGTIAASCARLACVRRTLLVIGIGTGDPEHLTVQAVKAIRRVDVFFLLDKGGGPDDLNRRRREICERYLGERRPRFVQVPDPPRDRTAEAYEAAVSDWTRRRADLYGRLLRDELGEGGVAGMLVWGDPSLYDAGLRLVAELRHGRPAGLELEVEVIPGITSPQALAARHGITLNRVGGAFQVTTGRRLEEGWPGGTDDVVVMLDAGSAFRAVPAEGVDIYWGANVGTEDEVLVAGPLAEVTGEIEEARAAVKARRGWVMDTYLLRRRRG